MRLDQLTFTRFLAAISIVVYHFGKDVYPFNLNALSFLFKQANIGVSYFFILSGFVMMIAYSNKKKIDFISYLQRRFARIYPVYFLALMIMLVYLIISNEPIGFKSLILNLSLLQSWLPGHALSFNFPGWSLSVEMFFYITFPFVFNFLYKKYSYAKVVRVVILFFIFSQLLLHFLIFFIDKESNVLHEIKFYFPLMHLNEFLIGNIAGMYFLKGIKIKNYDFYILLIVLFISVLLKIKIGINYHNGMLAFFFVPLIILTSANNGWFTKITKKKFFVFLGEISYGVYIFQKPVHASVSKILKIFNIDDKMIIFYIAIIALLIVSSVSFRYFETPLRKGINKIVLFK